ncbi:MAG: succinylglutamate desuccinylase/aspartoacylase family protein [Acidobacteriota bacterium]
MKAVSKPYQSEIPSGEHLVSAHVGDASGPTLIVVGSLHGNEPAGYRALLNVSVQLESMEKWLNGRVYLIAGNTRALNDSVRFIDYDLNRSWTRANMASLRTPRAQKTSEYRELAEIDGILDSILITARSEVYILDLHSTSADGEPFATVGDTLRNRKFAQMFPITILLGIEEQLEGTLLEYFNNAGAVTLGFEGGQHDSDETIENHTALVWLALVNTGILNADAVPDLDTHRDRLAAGKRGSRVVEIRYREAITADDAFQMNPGFSNFDPIVRGQILATNIRGPIRAPEDGLVIMPLYQKLGEDGFFVGRRVAGFWLALSAFLRRTKVQRLMPFLPGVAADPDDPDTLIVDTRIARYFPLQIFHLLGYRKLRWTASDLLVTRRKHDTQSPFIERTE